MTRPSAEEKLGRITNRAINVCFLVLVMGAVGYVGLNKFQNGWLRIVDLYVIVFGGILLLSVWLPMLLKVNVLVFLITIGAVEGLFGVLNRVLMRPAERTLITRAGATVEYAEQDSILGFKLKPANSVEVEKFVDSKRVFRARYTIDGYGRRVVPIGDADKRRNFLLFFGCSFTYGVGLNDDQTLPWFVGRLSPDFKPYNYAVGGYGPQHMLARLESGHIENEIAERQGKLVYVFIDDHVKRVMNTMRTDWVHHSPYYVADSNGRLIRQGNFNSARPYLYAFYHDVLSHSQILRLLNAVDFPLTVSDKDIELTAKIIEASARQFFERFGSTEFYVVMYPVGASQYGARLAKYLDKAGVKFFDYSGKVNWSTDFYLHPTLDLHPNAAGNRAVAVKLTGDLGLIDRKGGQSNIPQRRS